MAQIKWQNVNAPDFTPVANIQNTAAQQMNRGVDSIMGVFDKYAQMKENQYQEDKDENTQSAISDAMQIASSKDFQEAAQQGDFTAAALKDKYGSNINLGKLNEFISNRENTLLQTESGRLTLDNQQIAHDARGAEQQIYSLIGSGQIGEASKMFRANAHKLVNGDKIASALALENERASMRSYRNMQTQASGLNAKLALANAQSEMAEIFSNAAKNGEDLETLRVPINELAKRYNISPADARALYEDFHTNYSIVPLSEEASQSMSALDKEQANIDNQLSSGLLSVANESGLVPQYAEIALADSMGDKKYSSGADIVGELSKKDISSKNLGDTFSAIQNKYPNMTPNMIGRVMENSIESGVPIIGSGSSATLIDKSKAMDLAAGVYNTLQNKQKELNVYKSKVDSLKVQHATDSSNINSLRKTVDITNRQTYYNPEVLNDLSFYALTQINASKQGKPSEEKKK